MLLITENIKKSELSCLKNYSTYNADNLEIDVTDKTKQIKQSNEYFIIINLMGVVLVIISAFNVSIM